MRYMRQANSVLGLNYCYVHAAMNNFHLGRITQALADARESSSMASDNFGSDSGLKSLSDVALGAMLFWRNELSDEDWERFEMSFEHTAPTTAGSKSMRWDWKPRLTARCCVLI